MTSRLSIRMARGSCGPCRSRARNSSPLVFTTSMYFNRGVRDETTKGPNCVPQIHGRRRQTRRCDCICPQLLRQRRHDSRCSREERESAPKVEIAARTEDAGVECLNIGRWPATDCFHLSSWVRVFAVRLRGRGLDAMMPAVLYSSSQPFCYIPATKARRDARSAETDTPVWSCY